MHGTVLLRAHELNESFELGLCIDDITQITTLIVGEQHVGALCCSRRNRDSDITSLDGVGRKTRGEYFPDADLLETHRLLSLSCIDAQPATQLGSRLGLKFSS
jgi:hypothetical protein